MRPLDVVLIVMCSLSLVMQAADKLPARTCRPAPRPPIVRPSGPNRWVF